MLNCANYNMQAAFVLIKHNFWILIMYCKPEIENLVYCMHVIFSPVLKTVYYRILLGFLCHIYEDSLMYYILILNYNLKP